MTDIQCPTCGKPNTDDQNFCDHCGAPLFSLDPLPPDSPSMRDELFDKEEDPIPAQPQGPSDEASRLDSLLAPDEPLADIQEESLQPTEPSDEFSRLDDLVPALEEPPAEIAPQVPEGSDESSRLDDFFADDDRLSDFKPEKEEPDAPAFDPFLDPSARDELLGIESPPEIPEDRLDMFQLSSEDSAPGEEPLSAWDLLSEEPASKEKEPEEESINDWDMFSDPSSPGGAPAEEPKDEWDFLTTAAEDSPQNQDKEPAPESGDSWDFLRPPSDGEEPSQETTPAQDPVDNWDFLTDSESVEETPPTGSTPEKPAGSLDFLDPIDEAAGISPGEGAPAESSAEWGFLTPDPDSEPAPMGFSPDIADDDDDPIPEFGSPGFSDDSSWLDMLQDPETRAAAEAEAAAQAKPVKPQTDWLDKIKRLNKSSEMVDEDSSFPDWLSVSEKPPEEEAEEVKPSEPEPIAKEGDASPGALPGWLNLDDDDESLNEFLRRKDLTNEEYKPAIKRGITDKLPPQEDDDDKPADGLSDSQQIKFPSWAEDKSSPEKVPEDLQYLAGYDDESEEVSDPFEVDEEEFFDDLFSDELPSWLTSASTASPFEEIEEELSHGELPGWVEAMRPVVESSDTTGLSADDEYIENYGPLAGIPSVLPAEAELAIDPDSIPKKPIDLLATKSQQDYVNLLKKLISEENKTKTILKPAPVATQRVLRWLIALIMLVSTAGTVIFGGIINPEPPTQAQLQNTGYGALYNQIESLYDGQPVLIAHDYQPAAAGELHTAAAGVVDHLMKQGTYLSFVSTVPTGPALAEHFLATTQSEHNYTHTQQYINLGYLPGESAGLLSFVIAPKKIIPLAFDGSNAWGSPPLLKVDRITDFAMVLVITDDPDTAKIWIEQVGTILGDTPLMMVVSAQVEPLIQPYFRSSPQLLNGYVAGIIDSMNYEQVLGRPNLASTAWLPFNLGIIITVGTIFIGGLANGVLSLFSRHRARVTGDNK